MTFEDDAGVFDGQLFTEAGQYLFPPVRLGTAVECQEAERAFQCRRPTLEAGIRQRRRHDRMLRGQAGMKRFCHGAELYLRPAGHAYTKADGVGQTRGIQAEQPCAGGCRTDAADCRGRVPALIVVRAVDATADRGLHLEADNIGVQQSGAARIDLLSERQQRGEKHRRGVGDAWSEDVIIIECVRGRAVGQGRIRWCGTGTLPYDGRDASPPGRDRSADARGGLIAGAGHHTRHHVLDGMFSARERNLGPLGRHLGRPFCKLIDDCHGVSASPGCGDGGPLFYWRARHLRTTGVDATSSR